MTDIVPATVTQASPLQVRLDGAATATNAVALNAAAFAVNARVAVVPFSGQLLVLGSV